eukprot:TRINITY_DN584_c0_g2_i1.p1 TRINITY_DN584_c0_g2~~TRINITY_DN584_c0_g2_i1.p1  ORF type:complete len:370 (-),score=98.04 TRINITY_DN584_c0_g2_i1:215-1324(-)
MFYDTVLRGFFFFFFQAEDGIRDAQESRGLGDVYKRQVSTQSTGNKATHNMKFVIAYDGSDCAKEAIRYVLPFLPGHDVIVWVGFKPGSTLCTSQEEYENGIMRRHAECMEMANEGLAMVDDTAASALPFIGIVESGRSIGQELVQAADDRLNADCIVLGTRGQGEIKSKVYGSVAQSVLFEGSSVPALIVHPGASATREVCGHSVLFAVDGSERSLDAVERGGKFVTEGCGVYVYHAHTKPDRFVLVGDFGDVLLENSNYEQQCEDLENLQMKLALECRDRVSTAAHVEVPEDDFHFVASSSNYPLTGIGNLLAEKSVDMVVVGSRGETGMSRIWNGSLAHDLLHQAEGFALLVTHQVATPAEGKKDH